MRYWIFFWMSICLIIGACSDTKKLAPKEGRIAVIATEKITKAQGKVSLDKPQKQTEWLSTAPNNQNKIPHVSLAKASPAWKVKGAEGRSQNDLPMVTPVIVGDKIYVLDQQADVIAYQLKNGEKVWQAPSKNNYRGVGMAANKKSVMAIDENGTIRAWDTKGKELWKKEFKTTFRNAPLLTEENVYLLSSNNDLWVLNTQNGKEKWHYKTTAPQTLLQSMARPALANGVLVVPFSNGEVIGFDAKSGILLWSQDLMGQKMFDAIANLAQMSAAPVIENNIVYLVGHGGKTMAVHLKTGESVWQLDRGGKMTPLMSGNTLFFLDNQNHLLALNKKNGQVFWETSLEEDLWVGPYLIDERLILFAQERSAIINPKDGHITYQENGIRGSQPALTNDGLFFLGDNGRLYHWEKI